MANKVLIQNISSAIEKELTLYHRNTLEKIKIATQESMQALVKMTKAQRFERDTGAYRRNISSTVIWESPYEITMAWYVKDPEYRLTHLLENGHMTKAGTRTKAYGFLGTATELVTEEYVRKVEEAIANG
ncbi:hypothetical protein KCG48_04930 [Proteiniclasticum sp. BAD-10]|uniref:HK97 gp10 family phage protein n=1 Tax=Proteiniclasticum sediminis TaxID=2804028 RepID=A0A941HPT4_9CLOT|nr:hypothetical protein [Proteiniclasticum sediminis]MBR0575684.1 hypothetical protein [Proteiniclasticum sediminis]